MLLGKAVREDNKHEIAFSRAIDMASCDRRGIIEHLVATENSMGGNTNAKMFQEMMERGEVRFMFDGLDEAGSRAQYLADALLSLSKDFPCCPMIVTSRTTVNLSEWSEAIHLNLWPFSDRQLEEFIERWFAAKPSANYGLRSWLDRNSNMKMAAATPLVAALMCSLYEVGETMMPMSEMELYERRLEFLLGRWEQAKAVAPMPERARLRYMLFLMRFANEAHEHQVRVLSEGELSRFTPKYMTPSFNVNASALAYDCVGRGLLIRERGGLSLGHLAYQEFLAGRHMQKYNNLEVIASRLGSDWWRRPLMFYATLMGDIKGLVWFVRKAYPQIHEHQLDELVNASRETADFF